MTGAKYDFAGWVTKNDITCSDGRVIKQDAFRDNDGQKVPLVWNHNYDSPSNVLGHIELHNKETGIYGYGHFNDTAEAQTASSLLKNGDISSMSIGARGLKQNGNSVTHGLIYEVSLVLAGANPGALIESVITHSDKGDIETGAVTIYTDTLLHAEEGEDTVEDEKTIGDVVESMNEEQRNALEILVAEAIKTDYKSDEEDNEEENNTMKQNIFSANNEATEGTTLTHAVKTDVFQDAQKMGSLKEAILKHGINSIEMLFPDAPHSTNGNVPIIYRDPNTQYKKILDGVTKSPFSRIKTSVVDLTEDEARAKGYIKGAFKKEEFFSLIKRVTTPATVYKKQKLDRDDIVDITDFNVVQFMSNEMRFMLEEEIARALLVGDGREIDDEDKINETNIRPIVTDNEFFTIQKQYTNPAAFLEAVVLAMAEYRGSGLPTMFVDHTLLSSVKLLKGNDGRWLSGSIPSNTELATQMGVSEIVPTSFLKPGQAVIVNLRDYQLGASKGGEITNFDDFDIDYNQYKYLAETRLSGALTMPKSAINFNTTVVTGADNTLGGMTYGQRQADKVTEPEA